FQNPFALTAPCLWEGAFDDAQLAVLKTMSNIRFLYFLRSLPMSTVSTAVETITAEPSTKPVKVFRDRRLSVSIFRNHATVRDEERVFLNAYLQRTYKDGEAYKTTSSLGKDDLPAAQLLLAQAWAWMVEEEAASRKKAA